MHFDKPWKLWLYITGCAVVIHGYFYYLREAKRFNEALRLDTEHIQKATAETKEYNKYLENNVIPDLDRRIETGKFWLQVTDPVEE